MKLDSIVNGMLIILLITTSSFAQADPDYSVDFINDNATEIESTVSTGEGLKLIDSHTYLQQSQDGLFYLNITYTVLNTTQNTIPALKWKFGLKESSQALKGFENETIQPNEEKTIQRLVFGGIIQKPIQSLLPLIEISRIEDKQLHLRHMMNQLCDGDQQAKPYLNCDYLEPMLKSMCNRKCQPGISDSQKCMVARDPVSHCWGTKIDCNCILRNPEWTTGNNLGGIPGTGSSFLEYLSQQHFDTEIRDAILLGAPLESRKIEQ